MRTSFTIASVTIIVLAYLSSTSQTSCCTSLNLNLSWVRISPSLVISFEEAISANIAQDLCDVMVNLDPRWPDSRSYPSAYNNDIHDCSYICVWWWVCPACGVNWVGSTFVLAARHVYMEDFASKSFCKRENIQNSSYTKCQMCKACLISKTFYWNLQYWSSR